MNGKNKFHNLTQRELEVLNLVIRGFSNEEIAEKLFITSNTSKAHVSSILRKFGVEKRISAAIIAIKENLV